MLFRNRRKNDACFDEPLLKVAERPGRLLEFLIDLRQCDTPCIVSGGETPARSRIVGVFWWKCVPLRKRS
jgi:hypothetical protein